MSTTKIKRSFFERLTGGMSGHEEEEELEMILHEEPAKKIKEPAKESKEPEESWMGGAAEEEVGQLTVDMFQKPTEIVVRTMVAGVHPDDLDISITKDMITVKGSRGKEKEISEDSYYYKELYWGTFSRTIMLPEEVDSDNAEASLKNGLLTIKLPKIDKGKTQKLKIKTD